jgi:hypothetical protein
MKRALLVLVSGAAALSCSDTTIDPGIQLNLDRPVDISFVCYGRLKLNDGTFATTAQPSAWCDLRSPQLSPNQREPAINPVPPGQDENQTEVPSWYGFILQSASGTVAVSRMASQPDDVFTSSISTNPSAAVIVQDADPRAPGKNAISVGEEPIALVNDLSGCYEVTANAGSCDLSALDINSVLTTDSSIPVRVNRMDVFNGSGVRLGAKPAAMVVQPNGKQPLGAACTATPSGVAYVAYPGCSLVAGVDLATGKMTSGIDLTGGVAHVMTAAEVNAKTCVDECRGAAPANDVRPSSLSLQVSDRGNTTRLAIGADNAATLTVVDLDNATFAPLATAPLQVTLAAPTTATGRAFGVTAVSLSPQIAMGNTTNAAYPRRNNNSTTRVLTLTGSHPGSDGKPVPEFAPDPIVIPPDPIDGSPGGEGQYVYAVATDGTVRVADVLRVKKECDTNIDGRFVRQVTDIHKLQCFPVGDATNPPRRTGARGPGIEFPAEGPPVSVAIVKGLDRPTTNQPAGSTSSTKLEEQFPEPQLNPPSPGMLVGFFAAVSVSSGQVFVVNVDDDDGPDVFNAVHPTDGSPGGPLYTAPVHVMAHQLRDSFGDRSATTAALATQCTAADPASTLTGGPRASSGPARNVPLNTYPTPRVNEVNKITLLPTLLQEQCTGIDMSVTPNVPVGPTVVSQVQLPASEATRDATFPDLRSVRSESWSVTWEGALSNDTFLRAIDGPVVRTGQLRIDSKGVHLLDPSQPFCELGVEPLDYVQLRGCNAANGDADCPNGYTCYVHKDNRVPNLGQCMLKAEAPRLADACHDFLTTARRYSVTTTQSGELQLVPRTHVLQTTPIDGCTDDTQCQDLASYAATVRSPNQPGTPAAADSHTWQCRADTTRAPTATGNRCVEACATSADCDVGTVCVGATGTAKTGTCMESVAPPQACVNGPQRFEVHASDAFVVTGSLSGYVHPFIVKGGAGTDASACVRDPSAGPLKVGRIPLVAPACTTGADPITGAVGAGFEANPCALTVSQFEAQPNYVGGTCTVDPTTPTVLGTRTAPALKFRNATFAITLVDPWVTADKTCVADRQRPELGKIPLLLSPGFDSPPAVGVQVFFDQRAPFGAVQAGAGSLSPAFPVKVVRGPSDSIWVMDDGDFQAVQLGQSSTRGQVYRVSISALSTVNLLQ